MSNCRDTASVYHNNKNYPVTISYWLDNINGILEAHGALTIILHLYDIYMCGILIYFLASFENSYCVNVFKVINEPPLLLKKRWVRH